MRFKSQPSVVQNWIFAYLKALPKIWLELLRITRSGKCPLEGVMKRAVCFHVTFVYFVGIKVNLHHTRIVRVQSPIGHIEFLRRLQKVSSVSCWKRDPKNVPK
jgi:hypothetical protein